VTCIKGSYGELLAGRELRWAELRLPLAEMKAALPTQGTEAVHEAHDAGWDQLVDAAEAAVQEPAMPAAPLPLYTPWPRRAPTASPR
jgi:hypothetical protein